MKVLVTGCCGYLGSRLLKFLLDAGNEVIGIDNLRYNQGAILPSLLQNEKFTFHKLDVVKQLQEVRNLIYKADVIFPLAGLVGMGVCDRNPKEAEDVNLTAIKLLDKTVSAHQTVIFPNTNSGYGKTEGEDLCTEETPMAPISVYGKTKCEAEKVVLDIPYSVVFRLATVFGLSPRMRLDLLVNHWSYVAFFKNYMEIYEGHYKRNFVHIDDVCRAFLWAMDNITRIDQQIFNLGCDKLNMTKLELADKIKKYIPYEYDAVDLKDPDQRNYIVSSDKLKKAGFEAIIGLDETLPKLIQFYKGLSREDLARQKSVSIFYNA